MSAVLLDTHAWAWTLDDDPRLSAPARAAIAQADAVMVSPITFFEIGQRTRLGRWPEMAPHLPGLPQILRDQGGIEAPFTADIALRAAGLDWAHRDPFDRLICATAFACAAALISCDTALDGCGLSIRRVW